tara:strand:- start:603 stop:1034 length:432 start_codon:yes stop_codon:yes gene_type:complete
MEPKPPTDQRIVNDYFSLLASRKLKNVAWLYGMIATYGIKPDKLWDFNWGPENSIIVKSRKKPIYPLHPQWVILFGLKQKRPQQLWGRIKSLCYGLYQEMANQKIDLNITDLLLAHKIRRKYYSGSTQPSVDSPKTVVLASAS